jgi:Rare lipoprotein B
MTRHSFRILPRAAALAAVLLLAGCGFHLRDALLLPPDLGPVRVQSADPNGPLAQQLQQFLQRAGASMAAPDAAEAASLQIVSERWGDTPISVDQFGRSQEFTLRYAVVFDLRRADGSDLVPQQAIELTRDYVSVPTSSAGTEGEREILVREMRREMVSSILRRIDAVSRMAQAAGPSTPAATP